MKKFAALLMIFSLSLFSVGCEQGAEEEPAVDGAVGADMDDAGEVDAGEVDAGEVDVAE